MARRTATRRRPSDDMPTEERFDPDYDEDLDRGDDRPRGRSRRSRDEEPEDEPRGRSSRRSRSRDNDPDEDEPRGRRGRSYRDRDDEDEPRGRSRGRSRDDEDKPRRERGRSTTVGRGWGAVDKIKTGDYVNHWSVPERPGLFHFLEPEPFTVYAEHFIEELPKGHKKSYICLGDDCPLCDDLGDRPSNYAGFNILDLTDPDNPKVEFLRASAGLAKEIKAYAQEKKTKPINRWDVYFTIHRKREQGARYKLESVKARDLEEDFDVVPFEEDEFDEYLDDLVTEEQVVFVNTRSDLKGVVRMVDGD